MKAVLSTALASLSCLLILPVGAAAEDTANRVTVTAVHNKAELSYPGFVRSLSRLIAMLPPEPRHIDLLDRIWFTKLSPVEQDQYTSATWAISIMSRSRDMEVPIVRGGYFLLPADRVAMQENASIIFNTHVQDGMLGLVIKMRARYGDVILAADLAAALDEANQFHGKAIKTDFYHGYGSFNAIKACFPTPSGDMIVTGGAGFKTSLGTCKLYIPAETDVSARADIAFNSEPDIVVLASASHTAGGPAH
jgi:hypothetical protein